MVQTQRKRLGAIADTGDWALVWKEILSQHDLARLVRPLFLWLHHPPGPQAGQNELSVASDTL